MRKSLIAIAIIIVLVGGAAFYYAYNHGPGRSPTGSAFSTSIDNLAEAKSSETVELKNGGTYNLAASIVKKKIGNSEVKMLAYNGMIPGPTIKVSQGAEITVNFTNNTDVDSTIHSHGVRVANKFDGVPDVTQKAIKPGESFIYKITFPDAGVFWYHPHVREDYAQELGLYGNYVVTPSEANYWSSVHREITLFLDDILMENNAIAPFGRASVDHTLMGRFGNTMLVNGETDYTLNAKTGEVIRFYLTNSANTRTFNVSIPGVKMKLVGGDNGKYERETWSEGVVLSPSERAIVEVLFDKAGSYQIQHKTPERAYRLGQIHVLSEKAGVSLEKEFSTLRTNKDIITSIAPLRPLFDKPADKHLKLAINMGGKMMRQSMSGTNSMHMMPGGRMMSEKSMMNMPGGDPIEWEDTGSAMNTMSNPSMMKWTLLDPDTGKQNQDIDWKFTIGDNVKISIENDSSSMHPMQHPIHIHGQRFLVLSTNGKPNDNLVWKDTALIPGGATVELLVAMSNPGEWMAHCHIAEHLEAGMMLNFKVE